MLSTQGAARLPARLLEALRSRLARADAVLPLALVGLVSGIATGAVIIVFRWLTETVPVAVGLLDDPERFETLSWSTRLCLPVGGALVIGLIFQASSLGSRQVGVLHVMERLAYHSGRLPWRNAVMQFFGAALSIVCGHSVGREGPVIHVGAASSSLFGQWLGLPNNSLRPLVACGCAASIAASFNTPIAGVIFAMEVVMMEYTLVGFTPVILAAVAATTMTRAVHGDATAFDMPSLQLSSLWELPYVVALGFACGAVAACFIRMVAVLDRRFRERRLWIRMTFAGAFTGACAILAPEVMGVGYDTVGLTLVAGIGLGSLLLIALLKLLATTVCVSFGLPGGLIGPTIVIGATLGGALGFAGHEIAPAQVQAPGLYALLGMGAMMGATLQAPLAALMAILELTANPRIIMPGMLAIVTASLACRVAFRQDSIYVTMLAERGIEYRNDPVAVALHRTGVGAVMDRRFATCERETTPAGVATALSMSPEWILVTEAGRVTAVMPAAAARDAREAGADGNDAALHLLDPDAPLPALVTVRPQSTLGEALANLDASGADLLLVARTAAPTRHGVYGVLTRDQIQSSVRYRG